VRFSHNHFDLDIGKENGALVTNVAANDRAATAMSDAELSHGYHYAEFEVVSSCEWAVIGIAEPGEEPLSNPSSPVLRKGGWGICLGTGCMWHAGIGWSWKVRSYHPIVTSGKV
jgi:hypothetical protein